MRRRSGECTSGLVSVSSLSFTSCWLVLAYCLCPSTHPSFPSSLIQPSSFTSSSPESTCEASKHIYAANATLSSGDTSCPFLLSGFHFHLNCSHLISLFLHFFSIPFSPVSSPYLSFVCLILFLLPYAFMGIPVNRNSTRYNATHTRPVSSLMHLWSSDAGNQTGAHWLSSAMRGLILHYSRYWMNAWSCVKKSSGQCAAAGTQSLLKSSGMY